jgi:hypothetical protein
MRLRIMRLAKGSLMGRRKGSKPMRSMGGGMRARVSPKGSVVVVLVVLVVLEFVVVRAD